MPRSILLKSAIVGVLLESGRPMTIAEIRRSILAVRPLDRFTGELTPKRLSDALGYCTRRGLLRRPRRGVYEAIPEAMGRTTRWRYRRWERRFDAVASYGAAPARPPEDDDVPA